MNNEQINATLLIQLAKQQAELEAKEQELEKMAKENERLKKNVGGITQKTSNSGIYSITRKSGKKVYGFSIRDENFQKVKREHYSTKAEAAADKRELLKLRDENSLSTYIANQKQTFKDFSDAYIKKAEADFAINTVESAKGIIKNHLKFFENIFVVKCTKQKAQEWSNLNRKRIKPYAFNNALKLAKAIWNNAMNTDLTNIPNPFSNITPINIRKECKTREEVRIDKKQADTLLLRAKSMFSDYTHPIIATALYAGMREGEILGLRWSDIDFKNNTIFIQRQTQKISKKNIRRILAENPHLTEKDLLITSRLKTEGSKGIIPIIPTLANILKDYKKELMASSNYHELCFCKKDGMPLIARDFVKNKFHKVLDKAFGDEKFMHFHELRGSCATILHLEGIRSKVIQGLLRHEKLAVTEDIYMKVNIQNKEVSQQLEKAFA